MGIDFSGKSKAGLDRLKNAAQNISDNNQSMKADTFKGIGNYVINSVFQYNGKDGTSIEDYMKAVSNENQFSKDFQNQFELLVNMLDADGDGVISNEEELALKGDDNNVSMDEIESFINSFGIKDGNVDSLIADIETALNPDLPATNQTPGGSTAAISSTYGGLNQQDAIYMANESLSNNDLNECLSYIEDNDVSLEAFCEEYNQNEQAEKGTDAQGVIYKFAEAILGSGKNTQYEITNEEQQNLINRLSNAIIKSYGSVENFAKACGVDNYSDLIGKDPLNDYASKNDQANASKCALLRILNGNPWHYNP